MASQNSTQSQDQAFQIAAWLQDWTVNPQAFASLWEHFFPKMAGIAQRNMDSLPSRARDGEDVALSAFKDVYLACAEGRYDIKNRDELWRLLLSVTLRKFRQERRRQLSQKQGGGLKHLGNVVGDLEKDPIAELIDQNQMPEFVEDVHNQCRDMLNSLDDEELIRTAEMKLEGCSNAEISDLHRCSIDVTKRRLGKIRDLWQKHLSESDG